MPKPPSGPVPQDGMIEVPYPPPPARVQTIPPQKDKNAVWLDGQWDWDGEGWKWSEGMWVVPPPAAYFTPWTTLRKGDGSLLFARSAWRGRDGKPLQEGTAACPVPPRVPAAETAQR